MAAYFMFVSIFLHVVFMFLNGGEPLEGLTEFDAVLTIEGTSSTGLGAVWERIVGVVGYGFAAAGVIFNLLRWSYPQLDQGIGLYAKYMFLYPLSAGMIFQVLIPVGRGITGR